MAFDYESSLGASSILSIAITTTIQSVSDTPFQLNGSLTLVQYKIDTTTASNTKTCSWAKILNAKLEFGFKTFI